MSKLKDYYFINDLFDRTTAESYNGQSGYYNVNSNFFNSNWFWPENAVENYRTALVALFDKEYDFSSDAFFNAHYDMIIFTYVNDDDIYFTFNPTYCWNGNLDSNEYYGCSFIQSSAAYLYKFDGTDIAVVQSMGSAATYITLPVYKVLATTGAFVGQYPRHTIQANYLYTNGDVGNSAGGIHIPNPNPTRKIVINGSEPDDIKLNGITPDKIMLNGQCYFEKPYEPTYLYKWDFTKSLTDEVAGATATMGNATFTEGVGISGDGWIKLGNYIHNPIGKTYEIDFVSFEKTNANRLSRVLGITGNSFLGYDDQVGYICKLNNTQQTYTTTSNIVSFTNKTLKLVFVSNSSLQVYLDDTLLYEGGTFAYNHNVGVTFYIGDSAEGSVRAMETFTVTGVRIYANEE